MKRILIISLFHLNSILAFGQIEQEYLIHKASIDSMEFAFSENSSLANYIIGNVLDKPSDKYFISNRNLLKKLKTDHCDSSLVVVSDSLIQGGKIKVEIVIEPFDIKKHKVESIDNEQTIQKIDGRFPFGGQFGLPLTNINQIKVNIDNQAITIPDSAFCDLFNGNICNNYSFFRQIEVYESLSGDFIYVYLFGGNAAGTWFAKLIFDHEKYVTRIVTDYVPLSIHASFRDGFIGY